MLSIAVPAECEHIRIRLPYPEFEDQSEVVAIIGRPIRYLVSFIVDLYPENMYRSSCPSGVGYAPA